MLLRDSSRNQLFGLLFGLFTCFSVLPIKAQELRKATSFSEHKFIPFYGFKKLGNTSIFRGNKKKRKYFEGWYFKMVSNDGSSIISVIPGISLSSDGEKQHAFIQLINGLTAETYYYSFPIEDFSFSRKDFAIKIGENYFSREKVMLNLKNQESTVSGKVEMSNSVDYKSGFLRVPGIMGWYRFVPFMQCYHGVVSLSNKLNGQLLVNDVEHVFEKGKGYIEKDWGRSMPSSWIWSQSNHFTDTSASLMLSIADIPWLGKSFNGFLGFFYYNNEIHHLATYRSSKLKLEITESNELQINIENRKNSFVLELNSKTTGLLKAPVEGSMDRRIPESIDAKLKITMLDKKGAVVFTDSSAVTGLEMVGDFKSLQGLLK